MKARSVFGFLAAMLVGTVVLSMFVGADWVSVSPTSSYGQIWMHSHGGKTQVLTSSGVFENLTIFENSSNLKNMAVISSSTVQITVNGVYDVTFHSAFSDGGNEEFQLALMVNGEETENVETHRKLGTAGDVGSAGGGGLVKLFSGDLVTLAIKDINNPASSLTFQSVSLILFKID